MHQPLNVEPWRQIDFAGSFDANFNPIGQIVAVPADEPKIPLFGSLANDEAVTFANDMAGGNIVPGTQACTVVSICVSPCISLLRKSLFVKFAMSVSLFLAMYCASFYGSSLIYASGFVVFVPFAAWIFWADLQCFGYSCVPTLQAIRRPKLIVLEGFQLWFIATACLGASVLVAKYTNTMTVVKLLMANEKNAVALVFSEMYHLTFAFNIQFMLIGGIIVTPLVCVHALVRYWPDRTQNPPPVTNITNNADYTQYSQLHYWGGRDGLGKLFIYMAEAAGLGYITSTSVAVTRVYIQREMLVALGSEAGTRAHQLLEATRNLNSQMRIVHKREMTKLITQVVPYFAQMYMLVIQLATCPIKPWRSAVMNVLVAFGSLVQAFDEVVACESFLKVVRPLDEAIQLELAIDPPALGIQDQGRLERIMQERDMLRVFQSLNKRIIWQHRVVALSMVSVFLYTCFVGFMATQCSDFVWAFPGGCLDLSPMRPTIDDLCHA